MVGTHSAEVVAIARDHDLALIHAPSASGPFLEVRDADTLVDAEGKLVGVNTMIVGGLGVAIPAGAVLAFVTRATSMRAA